MIFDISNNHLTGEIPTSFKNFTRLEQLDLSGNNLSGSFPKDINLSKIVTFVINNNMLSGPLPQVGALAWSFVASNNSFSGGIPKEIGISSQLAFLLLDGNKLSGPIPNSFVNLISLMYLFLDHNMFQGTLPIVPIMSIQIFSVKNNSITGEIPSWFCRSVRLLVFQVSHNKISGTIPNCFRNGTHITSINLNENQLQGKVPRSLSNCRHLEVLELGNNMLNDTFPHWLDALPELQVLVLNSNRFHGVIDTSNTNLLLFPKLRILDLSGNMFTGNLPSKYFIHFKAMMDIDPSKERRTYFESGVIGIYQDSVTLVAKGRELTYERIFQMLTVIDLSNNKFVGEIPSDIRMLNSLHFLNLSHNHLTGPIPTILENLTSVESIDLSSNQLQGKIPTQLTKLPFLAVFNVSSNQLSGGIPKGGQFGTFEMDSYQGNPDLCGLPLSNKCGGDPGVSTLEEEEGSWFFNGLTWKSVVLGYGCGIVVGIGLGCLMLKTGKPNWLLRIVNQKQRRI